MRITKANLEALVDTINAATESPMTTHTKTGDDIKSNIGNYHLDWAYGGVKLVRMGNEHGGINEIIHGFLSKSETWDRMHAYLSGLQTSKS